MLQRPIYAYDEGRRLVAVAQGSEGVRIWRLAEVEAGETGASPAITVKSASTLRGMALLAEGVLVGVDHGGAIRGWDLESLSSDEEPETLWEVKSGVSVAKVASHLASSGRHLMALGGESGDVLLVELNGRDEPRIVPGAVKHRDKVEVLTFSDDDQRLASSGRDREIFIFGTEGLGDEAPLLRSLEGSGGWPLAMDFSQDHRYLATGTMDNGVYLWDLEADEPLVSVRFDHHGWVEALAFSPDDQEILTGAWDNLVGVFNTDPLGPRFQFRVHSDYVVAVLPVPGTTRVFAGSYDGTISVWDYGSGEVVAHLKGHADWVTELVWLGQGQVASFSSDGTVRLWDGATCELFGVLGEPTVESFELGGTFDLASFGLEGGEAKREDEGPDLKQIQLHGVRRFSEEDPTLQQGSQRTAMGMLDEAVKIAETVGADVVEAPPPGSSVGDELSDLVLDAISSPVEDVDLSLDLSEPMASIEELSDQAFMDSQEDVDIMDSAFDPAAFANRSEPAVEEEPEAIEMQPLSEPVLPEEEPLLPEGEEEEERSAGAPTAKLALSGPLYDPRPIGPDDDLEGILPDEDELDLAFFGSISEVSDGLAEEDPPDEEPPEEEPPEEDPPDEDPPEESSPGKADPPSAQVLGEAGGGEQGDDGLDDMLDEMMAQHPSSDVSEVVEEPEERRDVRTMQVDAEVVARGDRVEPPQAFFVVDEVDEEDEEFWRSGPFVAVNEEPVDEEAGNRTQFWGGTSEASEVEEEALVEEAVSHTQMWGDTWEISEGSARAVTAPGFVGDSEAEEELVDEEVGNRTQFWGGASEAAVAEPEESEAPRTLNSFQRREQTLNKGPRGAFGRSPSQLTGSLRERLQLQRQARQKEDQHLAQELTTPEASGADEAVSLVPVELEEFWERAVAGAPQMGILRRPIGAAVPYEPRVQVRSEHQGRVVLALSSSDKHLVTAGADGAVQVWKTRGAKSATFRPGESAYHAVGFVQGDSFLWALEERGAIHLWLLPKAALGATSHVFHCTIKTAAEGLCSAHLIPENRLLLTGTRKGQARVWSLQTGHCVARLADHGAAVTAVTMGLRGPVTATADGQIRFWNQRGLQIDQVETSSGVQAIVGHGGKVFWSEESGALLRMEEGESRPERLQGHHGQGRALVVRKDGAILSGGEDGRILVYDAESTEPAQEIHVPAPIHDLVISDRVMAAACEGGRIFVFARRGTSVGGRA